MSSSAEKTIEVEAAAEGPKVKAKRQMTEAQLAALKRGREKLAEKRKQTEVATTEPTTTMTVDATAENQKVAENDSHDEGDGGNGIENGYHPLCEIM